MPIDLDRIESEISPLLEVHGVELVAIEWLQGPGHGILRIIVDRPGGDPRIQDPMKSVGFDEIVPVTRDISTAMDALDLIEPAYTMEVLSPGPSRPVQSRPDFERFAGLSVRIDARIAGREKANVHGILRGTVDHPDGGFAVRVESNGTLLEISRDRILRSRLDEIVHAPKGSSKGGSRRQERLAAREKARAINTAHQAALQPAHSTNTAGNNVSIETARTTATESNRLAETQKAMKR